MELDSMEVDEDNLQPYTDRLDAYVTGDGLCACPAGYRLEGDVLVHAQTGVRCFKSALFLRGLRGRRSYKYVDTVVLYHYCPPSKFQAIIGNDEFNCSTNLSTDCDFGIGQYTTKKQPHAFADIWSILRNNYPRATAGKNPGDPGFPPEDRARFCIPFVADKAWTPAFPLTDPHGERGAVRETRDRYGPFDPLYHDIWVLSTVLVDPAFKNVSNQDLVALHKAAENSETHMVCQCLENGISVDALDTRSRAPLRRAAIRGHSQVVQLLLSEGANPSLDDFNGETALHDAVSEGHVDVVALLVSAGVPLSRGRHNETALDLARKRVREYGTTGKDKVPKENYIHVLEIMENTSLPELL